MGYSGALGRAQAVGRESSMGSAGSGVPRLDECGSIGGRAAEGLFGPEVAGFGQQAAGIIVTFEDFGGQIAQAAGIDGRGQNGARGLEAGPHESPRRVRDEHQQGPIRRAGEGRADLHAGCQMQPAVRGIRQQQLEPAPIRWRMQDVEETCPR